MTRIDELKKIGKRINLCSYQTKKNIYTHIITKEIAHYTLTHNKVLINLSKLQDTTIQGIINFLDLEDQIKRREIDI